MPLLVTSPSSCGQLGDASEYTVACLQLGHGMAVAAIAFVAPMMPVLKPRRAEL
ncbi:hypothetical protein LMG27174_07233 [Paraburkholderia rhynchosiae]|uniref:Uncharacterized protein n=1 Tax=Paraburkholderia rhynchosiae TaxID=487049 RepID=A0A6J5CUY1_9BURK|nr:hypothetical protein LMG27174_07233 [Paraburkholderia rhynchosiae]